MQLKESRFQKKLSKQNKFFWLAIGFTLILLLYVFAEVLLPFILGAVIAYLLNPVAERLEDKGLNRGIGTALIMTIFGAVIIGLCLLLLPVMLEQINKLFVNIPIYFSDLQQTHGDGFRDFLGKYAPNLKEKLQDFSFRFSTQIVSITTKVITEIVSSGAGVFNFFSILIITPIVSFYMIRDWDILIDRIDNLLPRNKVTFIRGEFKKIDDIISAYLRGQFSVCLMMAVFYGVVLSGFVHLNYGLAIGIVTGIFSFIPYVGMGIGTVIGVVVAYFQFGIDDGLFLTIAAFALGNLIESNFITPKMVGDKVQLHPVWVMFALLSGGAIFGFTGILIAIPVAAVVGVLVRTSSDIYMKSPIYLGYDIQALESPERLQERDEKKIQKMVKENYSSNKIDTTKIDARIAMEAAAEAKIQAEIKQEKRGRGRPKKGEESAKASYTKKKKKKKK